MRKCLCLCVALLFHLTPMLFAQQLKIATAANAQFVMKALQADYFKYTGEKLTIIVGSSGNLSTQIEHGAPYDVFLSADMRFPEQLYKKGLATTPPEVYALGSLIVCSNQLHLQPANWEQYLLSPSVKRIAIANAALAPYGQAAEEVLSGLKLMPQIKPKLVYGESLSQVNTYVTTGAAQMAFTTEAFAVEQKGKMPLYWVRVPDDQYRAIQQGVVLVKRTAHAKAAEQFYRYLFSQRAQAIFKQYGYRTLKSTR